MGRPRVLIRVIELSDASLQRTKRKSEGREIHGLSSNEGNPLHHTTALWTRKRVCHGPDCGDCRWISREFISGLWSKFAIIWSIAFPFIVYRPSRQISRNRQASDRYRKIELSLDPEGWSLGQKAFFADEEIDIAFQCAGAIPQPLNPVLRDEHGEPLLSRVEGLDQFQEGLVVGGFQITQVDNKVPEIVKGALLESLDRLP